MYGTVIAELPELRLTSANASKLGDMRTGVVNQPRWYSTPTRAGDPLGSAPLIKRPFIGGKFASTTKFYFAEHSLGAVKKLCDVHNRAVTTVLKWPKMKKTL